MRAPPSSWRRCLRLTQFSPCPSFHHLRATHAVFLLHGLHRYTYAFSRLILLATVVSDDQNSPLRYAQLLVEHSEAPPNAFIFNTLIRAASQSAHPASSLHFFRLMAAKDIPPNHLTFPLLLQGCKTLDSPSHGLQLHAFIYKNGLFFDHYVQTALLGFYTEKLSCCAHQLFDEMPNRDMVHWDVLMNLYIRRNQPSEALKLFHQLLSFNQKLDEVVLTTAITACARAGALEEGRWIHHHLLQDSGDPHLRSALVTMYSKCGSIQEAIRAFDLSPVRSSFLYSSLINGLALNGLAHEAISCVQTMQQRDRLKPDAVALLGALSACSHAGLVEEGRRILSEMEQVHGVKPMHEHYACAVDMLSKVGMLEEAVELVMGMPMKPESSVWGSMLVGCGKLGGGAPVEVAEMAVAELEKIEEEEGEEGAADGAHVQLWRIYMAAERVEDARRIRKVVGEREGRKVAGRSEIGVAGEVSSFVSGDGEHPQRARIYETVQLLARHGGDEILSQESVRFAW